MSGNLWIWFTEHLVNESQFVSINNTQLYLLPELSGVRQGSILGPLMFILYMNDLPDAIHWSKVLLFADDTICFKQIKSPIDQQHLQLDLDNLASWSISSYLSFNSSKSTHVSLNRTPTSYNIRNDPITTTHNHKDLGIIISCNLNWNLHHDTILRKAYRTLGLVQRTYSVTIPSSAKVKLYISIIRLLFTHVAIPLIKDIKKLEQLHCRATKYILNDYVSNYKTRLMYLRILSSMYIFDILFLINNPTNNFNINNYISFSTSNTRTRGTKLRHNISSTNKE